MKVDKLEAAKRQLETALQLYFEYGDEVAIHTLAGAAYSVIRDVNEHRGGEPMFKDLHQVLSPDLAKEFKKFINQPENFLKHANEDPDATFDLQPQWTEVLMYEASQRLCLLTDETRKLPVIFVLWFALHHREILGQVLSELTKQGQQPPSIIKTLNLADRREFLAALGQPI